MALRPVGTQFVTKGFNTFIKQLTAVDRQYQSLGKTMNLTGGNITAFGAKLNVFTRNGKAYAQWVDIATGSFLKHDEVQKRFQGSLSKSQAALLAFGKSFNFVNLTKFGVALGAVGLAFTGIKTGVKIFTGLMEGAIKVVKAAITPFVKLGQAIGGIVVKVADFAIGGMISTISKVFSALKEQIGGTVSEFQRLEIQYESLLARQIRVKDSTISVADSLAMAVKPAQELLDWVKKIAVATPFEVETIARTLAFSQAMGFTANQSKIMTQAIINFTSAMGLSQDTMERIITNFGQMRAAGKVTGTELRDLARGALLPIQDILQRMAQNMGVAKEDFDKFRKAAAEGKAPVDEFFKAFIDVANESFPNAAERMSRTFEGVKNNIVDFFKTIVGVNTFGPVFDRVTAMMADALDKLLSPAVREVSKLMGETLLMAFDRVHSIVSGQLIPAFGNLAAAFGFTGAKGETFVRVIAYITATLRVVIKKIYTFINKLAGGVADTFGSLGENAAAWGYNLISSFAKGMAQAAKLVVQVLTNIGNLIAGLLESHSPPKLLPDLGKWGAAAMNEYMKGWNEGDFNIFQDIAGTIEGFIRSISGTILKDTDVVPAILSIRDKLAKAMQEITKSGQASAKTLKEIFSSLSGGTPQLRKYVSLKLQMAEADEAVARAQRELNKVTEKYNKILEPLQRRLDNISDRGDEFDDMRRISQLQLILTDVNASAGDKERARIEIEKLRLKAQIRNIENEKDAAVSAAEDKLSAAEKDRDAIEAQLKAQEALIQIQIDTNNLIREQLDLLESLKDAAGGAGTAFESLDFGGFGGESFIDKVREIIKNASHATEKLDIAQIFEDAQQNIEDAFANIGSNFDGLDEQLRTLGETWQSTFGAITSQILSWKATLILSFTLVKDSFVEQKTNITNALAELGINFDDAGLGISGVLSVLRAAIFYFALITAQQITFIGGIITGSLQVWQEWKTTITTIFTNIKTAYGELWQALITAAAEVIPKMFTAGTQIINGLWNGLKSKWAELKEWAEEKFGWLIDLLDQIGDMDSPSKVMAKSGRNLMLGLAKGLKDSFNLPGDIMKRVALDMVTAPAIAAGAQAGNVTNNFTLNMPTTATPASVQRAFNVMSVMAT